MIGQKSVTTVNSAPALNSPSQPTFYHPAMSGPKNPANAALSAARRQNATLQAHDDARKVVKDVLDRRGKGQPPAALRISADRSALNGRRLMH